MLNGYEFENKDKKLTHSPSRILDLIASPSMAAGEKLTSSLMKKYKSIEKIKQVISTHREQMTEDEKKRSVSKQLKDFHVPVRNSKAVEQKEFQKFMAEHVGCL